jgi:hypothetical protein
MRNRILLGLVLGVSMLSLSGRSQSGAAPPLTALDRIEIEQLALRYTYGLDTAADNGYMYADVFTPDGEFVGRQVPLTQGREALARVARSVRKGNPMYVRHFITNHVIEPSPEGATGTIYLMVVDVEEAQPSSIYIGGQYKDVYVRTPNGWRIKRRDARAMGPPRTPGL